MSCGGARPCHDFLGWNPAFARTSQSVSSSLNEAYITCANGKILSTAPGTCEELLCHWRLPLIGILSPLICENGLQNSAL